MDELYVLARRVLLDALDALGPHRDSMILVGAQAIYLRVGEGDLVLAPYTTDGDLAIDPTILAEQPPLEKALGDAGFALKSKESVGVWITQRRTASNSNVAVGVDLLVPAAVSPGKGRRAARLPGHQELAARIAEGLEGALVDQDLMTLASLEPGADDRTHRIRVAGPAAMLLAKVFKIKDRQDGNRLTDKDALDVFRLLRGISTEELSTRYQRLRQEVGTKNVANEGLGLFRDLFGSPRGKGIEMLLRALGSPTSHQEMTGSCATLAKDLFDSLGG